MLDVGCSMFDVQQHTIPSLEGIGIEQVFFGNEERPREDGEAVGWRSGQRQSPVCAAGCGVEESRLVRPGFECPLGGVGVARPAGDSAIGQKGIELEPLVGQPEHAELREERGRDPDDTRVRHGVEVEAIRRRAFDGVEGD